MIFDLSPGKTSRERTPVGQKIMVRAGSIDTNGAKLYKDEAKAGDYTLVFGKNGGVETIQNSSATSSTDIDIGKGLEDAFSKEMCLPNDMRKAASDPSLVMQC